MANLSQIKQHLEKLKIPFKLFGLPEKVYKVEDVVRAGINEDEIVKTLIVQSGSGFIALAIRGKDRLDFKKVRKLFGAKSELARPEEVERIVGIPVGAVCPILVGIPLYFDKKVMELGRVNMGSGDLKVELEIELADLLKAVSGYQVEDLIA